MGKTLEKMAAAGLLDDEEGLTTPTETEGEAELELEPETNAVVAEDEDEGDTEQPGDSQDHRRVEVPKATLSQLRRTRREAREQVTEKDTELQRLRAEMAELRRDTLKKPQYQDFENEDAFEAALLQYHRKIGEAPAPAAQPTAQAEQQAARQPQSQDLSEHVNAHYDRAEKLGVNLDKFTQAERAFRTVMGEQITDALITSMGEGSEKAIMIAGSQPEQMARVKELLAEDPSGLRLVSHLTRIAARATTRRKTISDAPSPTRSPDGGAGGAVSADFSKKMAKAEKSNDVSAMVRLRRDARKAGLKI